MTIDLDTVVLGSGAHTSASDGVSLMEAVSALAGEPWSNSPSCTSPVIAAYARSLNDWLPDDERQRLKAYIPRLVGTAEPDLEVRRGFACADAAVRVFAPLAFAAAGLVEEAAKLRAHAPVGGGVGGVGGAVGRVVVGVVGGRSDALSGGVGAVGGASGIVGGTVGGVGAVGGSVGGAVGGVGAIGGKVGGGGGVGGTVGG
ncbi:MAG TPA: hypothetical protein VIM39_04150, partial [Candidatus Limnocylindrales bacterium]